MRNREHDTTALEGEGIDSAVSRRDVLKAGAGAGLGATMLGAGPPGVRTTLVQESSPAAAPVPREGELVSFS